MSAPIVMSTTIPAAGNYVVGNVIEIRLTFDQVVNVTGLPTVECSITSGVIVFGYSGGDGSLELTFAYRVTLGDDGATGIGPTFQVSLGAATIKNASLEDASLVPMDELGLSLVILDGSPVVGFSLEGNASVSADKGVAFDYRLYSKVNSQYQTIITWNPSVSVRSSDPLASIPIVPYLFNNTDASSTGHLFTGLVLNSAGPHTLEFIAPDPSGINVRHKIPVSVRSTATKITASVVRRSIRTTQIALSATDAAGDVDFSNTATITITSSAPAFVNVTATSDTESFVAGQALITVSSATGNTITFSADGLTSATVTT